VPTTRRHKPASNRPRIAAFEQRHRDRTRLERYVEAGLDPDDAEALVEFEHFIRQQRAQTGQAAEVASEPDHTIAGLSKLTADSKLAAQLARGLGEHGAAYAAFVALVGTGDRDVLERFDHIYVGSYDSPEAWARAVGENLGWEVQLDRIADPMLRPYVTIDYAGFAQEERHGWNLVQGSDGKTHVFRH
jgi:antirestriction protein